jgi:hypothetical protein
MVLSDDEKAAQRLVLAIAIAYVEKHGMSYPDALARFSLLSISCAASQIRASVAKACGSGR